MKKKSKIILCGIMTLIMAFVMAMPVNASAEEKIINTSEEFTQAIETVKNGDTIKLGADITQDITIPANLNIILELNGNTFTVKSVSGFMVKGELTVRDSSTEGNGTILYTYGNGTGAINVDSEEAKVIFESGTVKSDENYGIYCSNGGTAIVNGGIIKSKYAALAGNNTTGNMHFNINGGTLTAENGPSVYMPGQGTLTITDGVLNGGVSLRMGQVTISGGTINATTENIDDPSEYYNYSGNAWLPDALYVFGGTYTSGDKTYGNSLNLKITGGTLNCSNGKGSAVAVYDIAKEAQKANVDISGGTLITNSETRSAYQVLSLKDINVGNPGNGYGNEAYEGNVESGISGGSFSSDVSQYVEEGKIAIKYTSSNDEKTYHVGTPEQINDIVKNAAKGDKIEVLKGDIALSIPVGGVEVSNTGDGDVTVNDEAVTKGTPVVTTEPAQQPTIPSQQETAGETEAAGNSAKTGDDFNMTAVIALMGIAAATAAGTVVYGRRKRSN